MSQERLFKILLAPIMTEKTERIGDKANYVTFRVIQDATKREIARAVEFLFEVKVQQVRVLNVKGKHKRVGRQFGWRQDWRKAYVQLKPGYNIDFGVGA